MEIFANQMFWANNVLINPIRANYSFIMFWLLSNSLKFYVLFFSVARHNL